METVLIYLGIILSFLLINTFISAICWTIVLNMGYWWQLPNMELIMFTPIVNVIVTFILGAWLFKEKNLTCKAIFLAGILAGLVILLLS